MADTIQIDNLQVILNEFAKAVSAATTAVNNLATAAGKILSLVRGLRNTS